MKKIFLLMSIIILFPLNLYAGSGLAVKIPNNMKVCSASEECVMVETLCSYCCGGDAVNKESLEDFGLLYENACIEYEGGVCDCAYNGDPTPICENGECKIKITPFPKN